MYKVSLYPLAYKERWMFNMLVACIPSSFMHFGRFNIHSIDASLKVKFNLCFVSITPYVLVGQNQANNILFRHPFQWQNHSRGDLVLGGQTSLLCRVLKPIFSLILKATMHCMRLCAQKWGFAMHSVEYFCH